MQSIRALTESGGKALKVFHPAAGFRAIEDGHILERLLTMTTGFIRECQAKLTRQGCEVIKERMIIWRAKGIDEHEDW